MVKFDHPGAELAVAGSRLRKIKSGEGGLAERVIRR
jgi:hypothetical protein